MGWIHRIML